MYNYLVKMTIIPLIHWMKTQHHLNPLYFNVKLNANFVHSVGKCCFIFMSPLYISHHRGNGIRCKASNVCSKCKSVWYCGREHQKLHWKEHKKVCSAERSTTSTNTLDTAQQDFLFPEYEIIVEPEELKDDDILNQATNKQAKIWDDAGLN